MKKAILIVISLLLVCAVSFAAYSTAALGFQRAVQKVGQLQFQADLFEAVDASTYSVTVQNTFKTDWAKSAAQWKGNYAKVYDSMNTQQQIFVKDAARAILEADKTEMDAQADREINALQ